MASKIDIAHRLVQAQFPQWAKLPIKPVDAQGWDNTTFRLGCELSIRLPNHEDYAAQAAKEADWLPRLAPFLPLSIPNIVALGEPSEDFAWPWSIRHWIEGETVARPNVGLANDVADVLGALHAVDLQGPPPGPHNFFRGGELGVYDDQTREAIALLSGKIDADLATRAWNAALATRWDRPPVWIHGDLAMGNLIQREGRLVGVIDFGNCGVGDPACDLALAWMLFDRESRDAFRRALPLDPGTWARGLGWTLWKTLIVAAGLTETNAFGVEKGLAVIADLLSEHTRQPKLA